MKPFNQRTVEPVISMGLRIKLWAAAFIWVVGLLLIGSDGPWMPYVNSVGGLLFLTATVWLGRILPALESDEKVVGQQTRYSKCGIRQCRSLTPCVSAICSKAIT